MNQTYVELGALAAIFALGIREFFSWMKSRNTGDDVAFDRRDYSLQILAQMEKIETNSLVHIQAAIDLLSKRIVDVTHADNTQIIEILGEIKGLLQRK